jgi:hypothetical protein
VFLKEFANRFLPAHAVTKRRLVASKRLGRFLLALPFLRSEFLEPLAIRPHLIQNHKRND